MSTKKVVIVTGASSGIGKATALQLIKEGHTVYGAARRVDKMQDLVKAGGHAIGMDVIDHAQIKAGIQQVLDEQGRIDVLVNNAGYAIYGAVEDTSYEDAKRQFEVNIFGLAEVTKAVLPSMRKQKSGTIINISSVGGKIYTPLGAWYHATKHALEGWSDSLRLELKQFGVNVVIIEPGGIETEFGDVLMDPMIERSGKGPYADFTRSLAKSTEELYSTPGRLSKPSVIAETISKAVKASQPKTRYAAGAMSGMLLFMRRWLSDRMFDRVIMSQVK